jgi:peptide/nickel transport system substrate-binding protein
VIDTDGLAVDIYDDYLLLLYQMNLDPARTNLFTSKEVRQALFLALDRDSITQNIYYGFGQAAVGTQPKLSPAYAPDRMTPSFAFDPEGAKALLAQAGWTDSNNNGTVDKDGEEFKFTLIYGSGDSTGEQIVAYMQQAWKAIGVDMELEAIGGQELLDRLRGHDFDMFLNSYDLVPDGDQSILFACDSYRTGFNFGAYCNPEWDALNEQQKREFDPVKRTELLVQQSQIIWEDQAVGPLRFGIPRTGYNTRVHNFHPNGYGFLWSLPYVWVDAE